VTESSANGITVVPSGAALGAEIRGVDLSRVLDDRTVAAIQAAWDRHLVLLFRDQSLDDPQLIAFSRRFGKLDPPGPNPDGGPYLPDYPELNVISNVREGGRPIGGLGDGEEVWHADMTYIENPPKAAILHGLEVPAEGGDTYFANMIAAYETLPDDLKGRIEGRRAIHDGAHNSAGILRKGYGERSPTCVRRRAPATPWCAKTRPPAARRCSWGAGPTATCWVWRWRRAKPCWTRCGPTPPSHASPGATSGGPAMFSCGRTSGSCTAATASTPPPAGSCTGPS
jgi:alpha-ketoglutarate-dependent taurine dioxygenase